MSIEKLFELTLPTAWTRWVAGSTATITLGCFAPVSWLQELHPSLRVLEVPIFRIAIAEFFLLLGTLVVLTLTLVHCNQLKKPATTLKKPPAPKEVSDQQRLILMFLSTSPPSLVGEIAAGSSIRGKVELCMYHLEELEKVDFIYGDKSFEGRHWKLKQAGRKYLVDKKLLT